MPNSLCECPVAGWCKRHQMEKTPHQHQMCQGEAPTSDRGWKYFVAWEKGMLGATSPENPEFNPPPFSGTKQPVFIKGIPSVVSGIPDNGLKRSCGNCGGPKTWEEAIERAVVNGKGPGTELMKSFKEAGVATCPACLTMAAQMNKWGPDVCLEKIDEIVEDVLPRAKIWFAENRPFIHKLLPGVVEDIGIRAKIKSNIKDAIASYKESSA